MKKVRAVGRSVGNKKYKCPIVFCVSGRSVVVVPLCTTLCKKKGLWLV